MAFRKEHIFTLLRLAVAASVASACLACVLSPRGSSRVNPEWGPPAPAATEQEKAETKGPAPLIPVKREDKKPAADPAPSTGGHQSWEEDKKVKALAFDLAGKLRNVAKIKICLDTKADEWWIILYEDTGSQYTLHQQIWHRDQDKLEPYLVPKTVPKNQLEASLGSAKPEMACEVIDPPKKEPPHAESEQ